MELPRSILKDFAKVTNDTTESSVKKNVRGTVKISGETKYVQLDGSESLTPIAEVVDVQDGDRVLVSIENHRATILGNFTFPPSARKEQEAIDKAEGAQESSNAAMQAAQSAQQNADQAISDADDASRLAAEAKDNAADAILAAQNAATDATEAKTQASEAATAATEAKEQAASAQAAIANANAEMDKINKDIAGVQGDIADALKQVGDQAAATEAIKQTMETSYAKKDEVSSVEATLRTEITTQVGQLQTTVEQNYAAKSELTDIEGKLQSQITQNAEGLTSTSQKVEKLESDTTEARKDVDEAMSKADAAQTAAADAQSKAQAAQTAADEAKANATTASDKATAAQTAADAAQAKAEAADKAVQTAQSDLNEAKQNLSSVTSRVDATEAEIAEAQAKVDAAQTAVNEALADAAEANLAASNAQTAADKAQQDAAEAQQAADTAQLKADSAQAVADKAQEDANQALQDVAALTKRVTSAETKIDQNAEQISLIATKTEEIGLEIDNLEIGGRNLWPNSSFENELEGYAINEGDTGIVEVVDGYAGRKGVRICRTGYEGNTRIGLNILSILRDYKVGDEFTLSAWVKVDVAPDSENNDIFVRGINGESTVYDQPVISNINPDAESLGKWIRYTAAYKATADNRFNNCFILLGKNGDMTVSNIKFERGNKATDWTPAPEDFENNYYSKTETEALLQVESDKITSTVTETVREEITTTVEDAVSDVEIGGRNLALGTEKWDETAFSRGVVPSNCTVENGELTIDAGATNVNGNIIEISPGDVLTISFDVKGSAAYSGIIAYVQTYNMDPIENGSDVYERELINIEGDVTTEFQRISRTVTITDEDAKYFSFGLRSSGSTTEGVDVTNTYRLLKIERGTVATDWTPAPEDVNAGIENAQSTANEANYTATSVDTRVTVTESEIQQLADSISTLVTDSEGNSMMTQTSDGWRFDISQITETLNDATGKLNDLAGSVAEVDETVQNVKDLADDLSEKTAYIIMTTDDSGAPCIELGKSDNDFKVRITNTSVDFMDGSTRVAYVSNQALYIERAIIKNELQIGEGTGFVFKKRSNGNMGLRYVG